MEKPLPQDTRLLMHTLPCCLVWEMRTLGTYRHSTGGKNNPVPHRVLTIYFGQAVSQDSLQHCEWSYPPKPCTFLSPAVWQTALKHLVHYWQI